MNPISFFDRYLSLWVALCIAAGVAIGKWLPCVRNVGREPRGIVLTCVVNRLINPFTMFAIAWLSPPRLA